LAKTGGAIDLRLRAEQVSSLHGLPIGSRIFYEKRTGYVKNKEAPKRRRKSWWRWIHHICERGPDKSKAATSCKVAAFADSFAVANTW